MKARLTFCLVTLAKYCIYHGVSVKILMLGEASEHKTLLHSEALREAFIVPNGPTVCENLLGLNT